VTCTGTKRHLTHARLDPHCDKIAACVAQGRVVIASSTNPNVLLVLDISYSLLPMPAYFRSISIGASALPDIKSNLFPVLFVAGLPIGRFHPDIMYHEVPHLR
jgi:hypothetical protein